MTFSARQNLIHLFLAALIALVATQSAAIGQQLKSAASRVEVKRNGGYFLTVRAKEIPLTQVAAELSRQLQAPVILSRVMEKQLVTVDFEDLPLEAALQMLAPLPFVHYEWQGGSNNPTCREIFLNAYNEPAPVPKLNNRTVSFVLQGDTEGDGTDDPLQVSYRRGLLSVKVKKQSLTAVLDRIASQLGVSFSMKQDTADTVDLDFKDMPLAEAMSYFPSSVHLHLRKDINRMSTMPLLVEFAK
jgi:hypothetical protein